MSKKRGVSPLIATVLLIGFVISLVALVTLWGKNYIQEKAEKEGKLAEKQLQCENVKIEIVSAVKGVSLCTNPPSCASDSDCCQGSICTANICQGSVEVKGTVNIVIKNAKDVSIGKFTFRVMGQETEPAESYEIIKGLEIKPYEVPFPEDIIGKIEEVDVIPWLRVARGNYVPCSNQHLVVKVQTK